MFNGIFPDYNIIFIFAKKSYRMTTIVINEKTRKGKIILDLIKEMGIGRIVSENKDKIHFPNDVTVQAIREAKQGNTIHCSSFSEYLEKTK